MVQRNPEQGDQHTYSPTPRSERLSYGQEIRDDVAEMNEELLDAGHSPEELIGRNPFYDYPKPLDLPYPPEPKAEPQPEEKPKIPENEIYGMTQEQARENPKMLLDHIERLITAFENNEIVKYPEEKHFFDDAQNKLMAAMVLARIIKEEIYRAGLKDRHEALRERFNRLTFSS